MLSDVLIAQASTSSGLCKPKTLYNVWNKISTKNVWVSTCTADLQVDGEDGVGAWGVFVHQRVAHCPVPPSLLYDSLTLPHTVHSVHGELAHVYPTLRVLFQLDIHQRHKNTLNQNHRVHTSSPKWSCARNYCSLGSPWQLLTVLCTRY